VTDTELLPCPFCGSPPDTRNVHDNGGDLFSIGCTDNSCIVVVATDALAAAIAAWNRRAPDLAAHARGAAEERAAVVAQGRNRVHSYKATVRAPDQPEAWEVLEWYVDWIENRLRDATVQMAGEHRREEGG
jgi:hypothetical protein